MNINGKLPRAENEEIKNTQKDTWTSSLLIKQQLSL